METTPILVQKFGGTAMGSDASRARAVRHVSEARREGNAVVVVVSAMGRRGDPYATDTLLQLMDFGAEPPELAAVAARDRDLLMACGEIVAAVVLAHGLRRAGVDAIALTGKDAGIVTDAHFGRASLVRVEPDELRRHLQEGRVPVVAGFQGATETGDVTTLGRGGSDTTAAVLAVALGAAAVEFYKDVEGVFTADPKIVPDATLLPEATYAEIVELAHLGARIVHPRAVEIAMHGRVPMRILPMDGNGPGTVVRPWEGAVVGVRPVTGVAVVENRVRFAVQSGGADFNDGLGLRLFEALARAGVSVDMIDVEPRRIGFIADAADKDRAVRCLEDFALPFDVEERLVKVSVAGAGMHGMPGVMARVMGALHRARVGLLATTDSHANISCLVREKDGAAAVRALHNEFGLGGAHPVANGEAAIDDVG